MRTIIWLITEITDYGEGNVVTEPICAFKKNKNIPTQKSMELGLMEIKERTINNPNGTVLITRTCKVTWKGQGYFINKFLA